MKFRTLVKLPQYKRFNFEPRYYDPAKEEMENRKAKIARELGISDERINIEATKSRIRGSFRAYKPSTSASTLPRVILIIGVMVLGYIGFDYLDGYFSSKGTGFSDFLSVFYDTEKHGVLPYFFIGLLIVLYLFIKFKGKKRSKRNF